MSYKNSQKYCRDTFGNILYLPQCVISPIPGTIVDMTRNHTITWVYKNTTECNPYGQRALLSKIKINSDPIYPELSMFNQSSYVDNGNIIYDTVIPETSDTEWSMGIIIRYDNVSEIKNFCITPLSYTYIYASPKTSGTTLMKISYGLLLLSLIII